MDGKKWSQKEGKLFKKYEFKDFATALQFVNKVGHIAESSNHHPDISFGWGYCEITLFTHSKNKITDLDKELAQKIDAI